VPDTLFAFAFANLLEPHHAASVRVPVDEVERRVAIPAYVGLQSPTPAQERWLHVRLVIGKWLGLEFDPAKQFWCPVALRVEAMSGSSPRR
jgi:hypothetical protein